MDDLRTLLRDKADEMRLDHDIPSRIRKRARVRRIGNAALSLVLLAGVGTGALIGARELLNQASFSRTRPAEQPPEAGGALPIWPSTRFGDDAAIDEIQQQVDEGHQPWYLSPRIVAEVFAMEVLGWGREDIEASVRGDTPIQVAIANPSLPGPMADVRTMLTMERWRGRTDGILVVTQAETEILDLRTPVPGDGVPEMELRFAGSIERISQRLVGLRLALGAEGISPVPGQDGSYEDDTVIAPQPDGTFDSTVPLTDDVPPSPAVSILVANEEGTYIAIESFRMGPRGLPPTPTKTEPVPSQVMEMRDAIHMAANDRDWDALRALIDSNRFEFSFGGDQGPIAFWKRLEREGTPVREIMATLLSYSAAEFEGLYMWPTAAVEPPVEWTEEDLEPLRRIYSERDLKMFRESDTYYGWRVGIAADGDWIFFVAGD